MLRLIVILSTFLLVTCSLMLITITEGCKFPTNYQGSDWWNYYKGSSSYVSRYTSTGHMEGMDGTLAGRSPIICRERHVYMVIIYVDLTNMIQHA